MIRLGLTSKLSVLFACIGVIASGTTGYYAYRANRAMLVQEAQHSLLMSTQLLGQRFTTALADVADDALVLAQLPSSAFVAGADHPDDARRMRLEQVYYSFMRNHAEYLQIRLIARGHFGIERIRLDRDARGIVVLPEREFQEKGQFSYVFDTLATAPGHIYLSPIVVNHETGSHAAEGLPILRVGTPVVDAAGQTVGALVVDVELSRVFDRLERDLPDDYAVYLANEWGDFLVHPDPEQTFGFDRGRRVLMQDRFAVTRALFDSGRMNVMLNGLAQPDAAPGQMFAFVRTPFGHDEGNRFVVLGMGRPLADVLAPAGMLGERIVRMVLVSSLLAVILAILFARAITRPLQTLARAATHVFDDPAAERLPVARAGEIGVLARCFDSMRVEIRTQVAMLRAKQQELTHLAGHDPLTGLPNRLLFMEHLDAAIRHAAAVREGLAVMFVDLDRFKQINDQHGHSVGDRTLVAVAKRLSQVLRSGDMVARLGGDEFIVLMSDVRSPAVIGDVASRIQIVMAEALEFDEGRMAVGASIGVSEFPADGASAEELLVKADAAMYAAKASPQCVCVRYQDLVRSGAPDETGRVASGGSR
ncbi:sensor domain-containing diguanylate cyclase [Burkholderia cenocepacia]|uniref:sensor domain-containing diguanylate cyclase n=1 Tax=Burkholderia cenocepacia TaxID=95486 RepID=UPI000980A513|nr:sensor domain-containing diguanylate cyclase [Burkholderia cenocepacia]ONX55039.1 deoxyuridine 5'-triphosphate nucleotidohydrolase [Burkholderia cenocepacia]ONX69302.1 deoxyuridine 5'-triphosphate nucleotidohydrolase [Burkholderia cenocepacia]ONX71644.1 deoxyuridine 5'-triphosphate nucleotidohydrolase [Burkholderia cenocepacia]ONX90705.1 deoxyuridine 5'-triphosphate nucleotidohydrolase [Burkholderia cenocepacia]ONX96825.1 deoxyuridine 5'-triphosphate nucleotidohydrolase [Burkholderia cenoce